jgi:hypothetical protein
VLSLRKRRGRTCSLFGIVVLGLRSGLPGAEGLEGLHKDARRQRDANMRVWWKEKQGRGDYGMYELEWGTIILGRAGYNAVIVGK